MNQSARRFAAIGLLMLLGTLVGADIAAACSARCVVVSPPFCRRCLDVGEYTGITCQNSGSCGCFFTQNTCGTLPAGSAEDGLLEELGRATPAVCTDSAAPPAWQPSERS
jgi:hypothetical protein